MRFKFKGKRKLLNILRKETENLNIALKDVSYTTEAQHDWLRQETILLIENGIHYRVRNTHFKDSGATLVYEEIHQFGPNHFKVVQRKVLEESEGQK